MYLAGRSEDSVESAKSSQARLSQAAAAAQFQKRHEGGDSKMSGARAVSEEFKGGICRNLQEKTCLILVSSGFPTSFAFMKTLSGSLSTLLLLLPAVSIRYCWVDSSQSLLSFSRTDSDLVAAGERPPSQFVK